MLCSSYPIALICEALDCARSSHYYQANAADQSELVAAIQEILVEWPTYGYRRVTAQLQRQGWEVNHKRAAFDAADGLAGSGKAQRAENDE